MKDAATLEAEDDATSRSSSYNHTKGLDSSFDSYTIHLLADHLTSFAVITGLNLISAPLGASSYAHTLAKGTLGVLGGAIAGEVPFRGSGAGCGSGADCG